MINYIKHAFKYTNKYIILATPLILFSLISSLYILFSASGSILGLLITFTLFIMMLTAFLSGWFYMIKLCVQDYEPENPNALIKEFPSGVGEYFLPMLGMIINITVISCILLFISYIIGMKFIGNLNIPSAVLSEAMTSSEALKKFLMSLSQEQLLKLNAWNLLIMLTMGFEYFMVLFYSPAVLFKSKNPFKALFYSLKDLLSSKFLYNMALYFILFASYFFLSVFTTLVSSNPLMHFVCTLANFYYLVFAATSIFYYYFTNFVKIGSKIDKVV